MQHRSRVEIRYTKAEWDGVVARAREAAKITQEEANRLFRESVVNEGLAYLQEIGIELTLANDVQVAQAVLGADQTDGWMILADEWADGPLVDESEGDGVIDGPAVP